MLKGVTITFYGFWENVGKGHKELKERLQDLADAAGAIVVRNLPKTENPTSDTNLDDNQLTTLSEPLFLVPTSEFMDTYGAGAIEKFQVRKVDWLFEHIGTCRRPQVKPINP